MLTETNLILMTVIVAGVLAKGWRRWPVALAPAHDLFRSGGASPVFRENRITGQLVPTGLKLDASSVAFEAEATFVLLPPMLKSNGVANLNGTDELSVRAVTRFPSMKSYFVMN